MGKVSDGGEVCSSPPGGQGQGTTVIRYGEAGRAQEKCVLLLLLPFSPKYEVSLYL